MLLWVANLMQAQLVQENETAVVYYMPKTELVITLSYECIEQEPGIFYQYAQRYLGAKDIVTEKKTTYQLSDMALSTQASADKAVAELKEKYPEATVAGISPNLASLESSRAVLAVFLCANNNILVRCCDRTYLEAIV